MVKKSGSQKTGSIMQSAIYLRSCKKETADDRCSIEMQKTKLTAFCKKQGWQINKVFIDEGYSGNTLKRPGLKNLLQELNNKRFHIVLVYSLDRLSRSLPDFLHLIDEFLKHNIALRTCIKPQTIIKVLDLWNCTEMNKLLKIYNEEHK